MKTDKVSARLRQSQILNAILAIAVVVLVIALIVQVNGNNKGGSATAGDVTASGQQSGSEEQSAAEVPYLRNDPNDEMAIGNPDAPVTISEWTDYRCPFCAVFANKTLPPLVQEYVDKGLVRIEFNDVAFFGDESLDAAVAARAAAEQGHYLPYIEALYKAAPQSGHPDMPREKLVGFAEEVGVPDMKKFEADLDSPELRAEVQKSQANAQSWGISSVPFFVINDQGLQGAQSIDVFKQVIESELAKVK